MAKREPFGARLRRIREAKRKTDPDFSLRKFAQRVGISPTFLSKVETGDFSPPSAENIKKMAALLEVNADEFLALAEKVDPEIERIIMTHPRTYGGFLRAIRDAKLSDKELRKLTESILASHRCRFRSGIMQ